MSERPAGLWLATRRGIPEKDPRTRRGLRHRLLPIRAKAARRTDFCGAVGLAPSHAGGDRKHCGGRHFRLTRTAARAFVTWRPLATQPRRKR